MAKAQTMEFYYRDDLEPRYRCTGAVRTQQQWAALVGAIEAECAITSFNGEYDLCLLQLRSTTGFG